MDRDVTHDATFRRKRLDSWIFRPKEAWCWFLPGSVSGGGGARANPESRVRPGLVGGHRAKAAACGRSWSRRALRFCTGGL
jgi:hypothetical protein